MNILFCQPTLQRTGSEKSLFGITKVIKTGPSDRIYLLAGEDGPMRDAFQTTVDGVWVVRALQLQKRLSAIPGFIKSFWTVFAAIRRLKQSHYIDVVYVNSLMFPQALIGARLSGLPCVVHIREIATKYPTLYYYTYLMLATLLARRIVCVCRYIQEQDGILFRGRFLRKARVIYNSSWLQDTRIERSIDGKTQLLVIGGVARVKGAGDLVTFAKCLRNRLGHSRFQVELIGLIHDPQLYKDILAGLAVEGLGAQVQICGDQADVVPFYRRAHILVHLAHSEVFSRALVEAANFSLPVVTTDPGGSPEAVADGKTGFVVPVADAEALADRVARLIEDPALYGTMAANAFERYKSEYTPEQMMSRIRPVVAEAAEDPAWA